MVTVSCWTTASSRHLCDSEAIYTYEGTDTVQELLVGSDITGHYAFLPSASKGNTMPDSSPLLHGLHVVDLPSWIAGPAAATVLSDFGADVIKVEPPGVGDAYRFFSQLPLGPSVPGFNYTWQMDTETSVALL